LLEELAKSFFSFNQFVEYMQKYKLSLTSFEQQDMKFDKYIKVEMLTMHAVKGLEFDHVFIMDVNEGNIPHKKALNIEEIEEERRLLYVSITRAKDEVYLLYLDDKKNITI
jgi:DNA helicase-2/ATP-dependent DNA helicase PcrA